MNFQRHNNHLIHVLKVTQINYVSRDQLHNTANGCQHLTFGLMYKGKTLLEAINKLFVFSSADPKQNINAEWAQKFKFLYTALAVHEMELPELYL